MYNCSLPASDQVTTKFLLRFHRYKTLGMEDDDNDDVHVHVDRGDDILPLLSYTLNRLLR